MACGTGSGNFPQPGDPSNDSILSAAPAFGGIDVRWTFPNINPQAVAHVRLYRSTAGTAGSHVFHTLVNGDFFFDRIENVTPIEYFYWIEVVSVNGTIGELIGPASAVARPPLEDYLELISGEITRGMLATALRTELDQLPLLDLRLLEEIDDRINGESIIGTSLNVIQDGIDGVGTLLNEEVVNRTTQYSALMQVINTLAASTDNTSGLIQQEATARADADEALAQLITTLQAVVNDPISGLPVTYAAIRNESIVRASAIDAMAGQYTTLNAAVTNPTTGLVASHSRITQEATARADAISAVNNVVTTLRSEIASPITGLPAAFAGLQQEAITRVSAVEALSSEYDALYAQVNNVTTGLPAAHAGILIESTARVTADLALADRLELLQAVINHPVTGSVSTFGLISNEMSIRAEEDAVLAESINQLQAAMFSPLTGLHQAHSLILEERTVRTSQYGTMAQQTTDLQSVLDHPVTGLAAIYNSNNTKITTYFQGTQPASATSNNGDLWINPANKNVIYRYNKPLDQWESARDDDVITALQTANAAMSTATSSFQAFFQNDAPATGMVAGDFWFDTNDNNTAYRWNPGANSGAGAWEAAPDDAIAQALIVATSAQATADGKVKTFYQTTPPLAAESAEGDLWIDTDNSNRMHRWSQAANGGLGAWLDIRDGGIDTALQNAAQSYDALVDGEIKAYWQATAPDPVYHATNNPTPPVLGIGDIWFDTDASNAPFRWNGTAWISAANSAIAGAFLAAGDAQSTADGKIVTFYQASPPTAQAHGDLWVDTDNANILHRWDSAANSGAGAWVPIRDAGINEALQDAAASYDALVDGEINAYWQTSPPTASGIGDIWFDIDANDMPYRWDGTSWIHVPNSAIAAAFAAAGDAQSTADGKIKTFYQTEPPTAEGHGDLWVDTNNSNILHFWDSTINSGTGGWVQIRDTGIGQALQNAANAQDAADGKIQSFWQSTTPTAEGIGDIWFDTGNENKPYRWDGTAWLDARDSSIAGAFAAAAGAQATADGKITTYYQTTAPTGASEGDLWVDTDNQNLLSRWSAAGAGSWVAIRDGLINTKIRTFYQTAAPTGSTPDPLIVGDLWVDTDNNNLLHRWNGTTWVSVQDGQIQTALGRNTVFYQASAPTANRTGDIWFDTDDFDQPYIWDGDSWEEVEIATYNRVTARIRENNQTMVGYCQIGGVPDLTHTSPTACTGAGGTWITAAPIAQSIKTAQVTTVGGSGTIEEMMQVYEDDLENINAQYTVKLQVNGTTGDAYIGGFGLMNSGTVVDAIFDVDNFSIGKIGSTTVYPFMVQGGETFINDAVINKLTFEKLRATDGSLIFEDGKLQVDYIDIDNLIVSQAQSSDYTVPGAGGWKLENNGHAEFNDIVINQDAWVNTLHIAGNAVTVTHVATAADGSGGVGSTPLSFSFSHGHNETLPVIVYFTGGPGGNGSSTSLILNVNGSPFMGLYSTYSYPYQTISKVLDVPPGGVTFSVVAGGFGGTTLVTWTGLSVSAFGAKR